ncbi:MAG: hypothetical protein JST37_13445 [Bacteroidetes bacterium]|nr:hypothetical protein [Bacteroidota bacterium]MBS1979952.1 hypothetical protein [Bacteroidota bacterium]
MADKAVIKWLTLINGGPDMSDIHQKISSFKKKFYLNLFLKGTLLLLVFSLSYFLLASVLEYSFWLNRWSRFFLLFVFIVLCGSCFFIFLRVPLKWWLFKKGLSEEESARLIGKFFPSVADRLLNIIQLSTSKNDLARAGVIKKSEQINSVPFEQAVDFKRNKKYLRYLLVPVAFIVVLTFVDSTIFTKSPERIIKFNQEFSPEAPFSFHVINENLRAYFNEDFVLQLSLDGNSIPESCYILSGSQRWKMENLGAGKFSYTFEKLQQGFDFQFQSAGFFSPVHKLTLIKRPEVSLLNVLLFYPKYTGKPFEQINNAGNLQVPVGTKVRWKIMAINTTKVFIGFASKKGKEKMQQVDNQLFQYESVIRSPDQYSIFLENGLSSSKDVFSYTIETIKDQYPEIVIENLRDTVLYKSILTGGSLKDDYGLTELFLHYEVSNKKNSILIPIAPGRAQQNFYYNWAIDSLHLRPGDRINYYFEVWDNDAVNGRKSSRSASYSFSFPTKEEFKTSISEQQQTAESTIDKSLQKAKSLRHSIDEAQQKLKGKQSLNWDDKKMLEDLVNQREKLNKVIDELQKENKLLEQKKDMFSEENERIKERSEQLQKLMNDLLDPETKKLFDELEKLLKDNADLQQVQKMLDKMDRKEINLEKELERTLSLFKQLKFDYKLDQAINEIKSTAEKQEGLIKKTDSLSSKTDNTSNTKEKLQQEQKEIKDDTKNFEKTMEELKELGKEANPNNQNMPTKEDMQELDKSQQESEKSLEQGEMKKSVGQQKKAANQMKQMQKQLQSMQNTMEMEIDTQNLESIRQIAHGLIKLSFDQEGLMKEFNSLQQADPKMIQVSQNQIKIENDSKVLEDSLLSLSKRDPFLASIVTREVGELNNHISKSVYAIKERRKGLASSEMQFSMTSINNLALMLNEHFDMMMKMMANAKPSKNGKGKKGGSFPSLSKMQQSVNDKIEQLKNGQKTGQQFSEELARMAAEQERIRKALQQLQEKMKQQGQSKDIGNGLTEKMEQTELDLINKQITDQTIRRQKEIMTRLLQAEKSMREQNLDEERKGETAKEHSQTIPPAFEEYLRLKEKEVELLKNVPPKLLPYYKKQVDEYFKRIN